MSIKNKLEEVDLSTYDREFESTLNMPKYCQWITDGTGNYYPESKVSLVNKIPSGYYQIDYDNNKNSYFLTKITHSSDKIFNLPMPEMDLIIKDITTFWKKESDFKRYDLIYKRGIILYGLPGGGKTQIIQLIVKHLVEKEDGIVFKIESEDDLDDYYGFVKPIFREVEPNRKLVVVIEDIDGLFNIDSDVETRLLNLLDGMGQIHNVVYLATTNFPEQLNDRVINRPSRFDRRYEISLPNDEVRKSYFEQALKEDDLKNINIDLWVKKTEGLSIAHLREVIVSTIIQGNTFEETIKLMQEYNDEKPSSSKFDKKKKKMGFNS